MLKKLVLLLTVLVINCSPAALSGESSIASAGDPHFDDRNLWPEGIEKTAYVKQTWPKGRLLVWAHPGSKDRHIDPTNSNNWLENGKPAARLFDSDTDLLFPDAEEKYHIGYKRGAFNVRHVTVGKNASVSMQTMIANGNVWIKKGGRIIWLEGFSGSRNTFARNDNREGSFIRISNKLTISKSKGASVEIVGCFDTGDDLNLHSGTMIIGPDSTFMPGDRSVQGIFPEAALILMSGSRFHKRGNQHWNNEMVVAGKILAGTPERPLTKDCFLGLSYKAKERITKEALGGRHPGRPDDYSLVILPDGMLSVHSESPKKARLVIGYHGRTVRVGWGQDAYTKPEPPELKALPHKIDMVLLGDVRLNGVMFDHILEGGILLRDLDIVKKWQNIFYGRNNAAAPDSLYKLYDGPTEFKLKG